MIVCIADLLTPDEVAQIKEGLAQAEFVPGATTAGWHAKQVKQNEQATKQSAESLKTLVQNALVRNALFQAIAYPRIIHSLLFSRYGVGLFAAANCIACHVSELRTDPHQIPALANQTIHPYTDLLSEYAGLLRHNTHLRFKPLPLCINQAN